MNPCPTCGNDMPALNREGQPRLYCGPICALTSKGKPKVRDMYADEAEYLLSFGTPIPAICKALDVTPSAIARALYREHRPDLANPFERYAYAQRRIERAA